jgi:DNA helicase-2/ATP-dependent DNA helicase PcrA
MVKELLEQNKLFEERIKKLNKAQMEAVEALDGPVIVVAGPGSGKTELLSLRIANIIYKGLAKPDEILCLTFTESASKNMLERLTKIIGSTAYKVPIFTFHAFCTEIISKYPEHFFDAHRFEPIAELKQNEILESIFKKLRYASPLFGYHEEKGYAYFDDVKVRIQNFKEAGLTPSEVRAKLEKNKKELEILNPILEKVPESLRSKADKEKFIELQDDFLKSGTEVGKAFAIYLEKEIENENLSKAKLKLFEKNEDDKFIFKEEKYLEKLFAACDIYEEYQKDLNRLGLFDFNDMIIYVRDRLINNNTLRAELEETYQYILIDEFQDTNLAQIKLIESITQNPVLEGRANVFVVGDDDQSIFKFQGAELNNIFNFQNMYREVKFIVLTENYRSTQKVLDFAKNIIEKAGERLTKLNKDLVKELVARNKELKAGEIIINGFDEKEKEFLFVAKKIKSLLEQGVDEKEIAIISRKHADLQEILPYLDSENISYNYERKESVFEQVHIEPLIKICKFLESIGDNKQEEADELLPEILSYPFFDIDRISIWKISEEAYKEKKTWLATMEESKDEKISELAKFFIELGLLAKTVSLEIILDILIGSKDLELSQDENQDEYFNNSIPKLKSKFVSNYKSFYFGEEVIKGNLASYIHFLSSLRVFIYALREFKKGEKLLVGDLSSFIDLHKSYKVALLNKTSFVGNKQAINLMTAYKAKGLEFEYVFLISADESVWKSKGIASKIPLPMNMPYSRMSDNEDDFLRLFFVGVTRAKHTVYITHCDEILSFLADFQDLKGKNVEIENADLKNGLKIYNIPPFAKSEKALLEKVLENYKLSPTHLNNFLNITKGGPKLFLEQNLLLFPQAKSSSAVYGSALHKAIEEMYVLTKKDNQVPSISHIKTIFENEIKKARLFAEDEKDLINKGEEKLENFYKLKQKEIVEDAKNAKTEVDFKNEGIIIDGAEFKGKIDRISIDGDEIKVIDLKSGKAFKDFEIKSAKKEDYENIKKHNYKQQLMFYKILLENSRSYKDKKITSGALSFIDDENVSEIHLDFERDITRDEWNDFKNLIIRVYKIIKNIDELQKIDISKYEANINGILEFERDLIEGKI